MPWPNVARRVTTGSPRRLERYHHEAPVCPREHAGTARSVRHPSVSRLVVYSRSVTVVRGIPSKRSLSTPHWMTRWERGLLMATTSTSGSREEAEDGP
jgi:hypothetical protein